MITHSKITALEVRLRRPNYYQSAQVSEKSLIRLRFSSGLMMITCGQSVAVKNSNHKGSAIARNMLKSGLIHYKILGDLSNMLIPVTLQFLATPRRQTLFAITQQTFLTQHLASLWSHQSSTIPILTQNASDYELAIMQVNQFLHQPGLCIPASILSSAP